MLLGASRASLTEASRGLPGRGARGPGPGGGQAIMTRWLTRSYHEAFWGLPGRGAQGPGPGGGPAIMPVTQWLTRSHHRVMAPGRGLRHRSLSDGRCCGQPESRCPWPQHGHCRARPGPSTNPGLEVMRVMRDFAKSCGTPSQALQSHAGLKTFDGSAAAAAGPAHMHWRHRDCQ